jgi:prohibitin 2
MEIYMRNLFSNRNPDIKLVKWAVIVVVSLIALFIFSPFVIVPNGHRGVLMTFGKASNEPLNEGIHFRIPLVQRAYKMPVQIQRSETEAESASRDLQRVTTIIALNFHVNPGETVKVFRSTGDF